MGVIAGTRETWIKKFLVLHNSLNMNSIITPSTSELEQLLDSAVLNVNEEDIPAVLKRFSIPEGTDFLQVRVPEGFTDDSAHDGKMVICVEQSDFGTVMSRDSHPQLFDF